MTVMAEVWPCCWWGLTGCGSNHGNDDGGLTMPKSVMMITMKTTVKIFTNVF